MTNMPLSCSLGLNRATLSAFRDQELSAAEMARVAAHIGACRACQQRLDQFARIAAALNLQAIPDLRESTWRGLAPRLVQHRSFPMTRLPLRGIIIGATVIALLAAFAIVFTHLAPTGSQPDTSVTSVTTPPTTLPTATAIYATATASPATTATPASAATATPNTQTACHFDNLGPLPAGIPFPPKTSADVANGAGGEVITAVCTPGGTQASITSYENAHLPGAGWRPFNPATDKNGCADTFWTWVNGHTALHLDFTSKYQGQLGLPYWTVWTCNRINV